jgi:hypothetical protein
MVKHNKFFLFPGYENINICRMSFWISNTHFYKFLYKFHIINKISKKKILIVYLKQGIKFTLNVM